MLAGESVDVLFSAQNEGGALRRVRYVLMEAASESIAGVELVFSECTLSVRATDDDQICLSPGPLHPNEDEPLSEATTVEPWCRAIGRPLIWAWLLVDHLGCTDGVQFWFAEDVDDKGIVVQMIAAGSQLRVRVVSGRKPEEGIPDSGGIPGTILA